MATKKKVKKTKKKPKLVAVEAEKSVEVEEPKPEEPKPEEPKELTASELRAIAREKRNKARQQETEKNNGNKEEIRIEIGELFSYKLLAKESKTKEIANKIKQPLIDEAQAEFELVKKKAQEQLEKDVQTAFKNSVEYIEAYRGQVTVVNEILDFIQDKLPDGYSGDRIIPEEQVIICKFSSGNKDSRIPLPEVLKSKVTG